VSIPSGVLLTVGVFTVRAPDSAKIRRLLFSEGGSTVAHSYLDAWRLRWQRSNFPTHPLHPAGGDWKGKEQLDCADLAPDEQWRWAFERGDYWNMGTQPGRERATIDCDAPGCAVNALAGLAGLGVAAVTELTPREGGAHLWLRVADMPEGSFYPLAPDVGNGHILTGRANVAVTCSAIGDKRYRFLDGQGPELISALPVLRFRDMTWLLPMTVGQTPARAPAITVLPLRLLRRDAPAAVAMLADLKGWPAGIPYHSYTSASEAEAAAVAEMILAGWSFDAIKGAFERYSPGAFMRRRVARYGWLQRTHRNVLSHLAATPPRPDLAATYQAVKSWKLPGRGGELDKRVLLGLLAIAWQWKSTSIFASVRDLAEHAAAGRNGVSHSLTRLHAAGLIKRLGWHDGTLRYDVSPLAQKQDISHWGGPSGLAEKGNKLAVDVEKVGVKSAGAGLAEILLPGGNELWGAALLGRSAGSVYERLGAVAQGAGELAMLTGRCRRTVEMALHRLASVGLAERIVAGWVRGKANVAKVASVQGAPQQQRERRQRHGRERLAFDDLKRRAQ